ncbi:uncharacterized protein [Blastocystis hominis]|uniref:NADH-ubiquinone oxidoreductase 21kDa subunit N-terminal domain-containing protein n=1 Tax=Blastocystis hominis TaxID=12968 RepID=D8M206_BLAHO|nr:uncharacterized protein [Blastocystis hominis]CBK22095.2 unnamed protein product [Blastocystis hominis]|eukprot:XP_012896143.1 uncharacterized protein [Blastocystis hominis]
MSEKKFDPQTLDNYESFHKEFTPYEWARLGIYGSVFAPFGWFIANTPNRRVRAFSCLALFCLGAYCGHCVSVTSARERLEKRRWEKYHC